MFSVCGRYRIKKNSAEFHSEFGFGPISGPMYERLDVRPTQLVPVVGRSEDGSLKTASLHWGLIPNWSKDRKSAAKLINARAETLQEKRTFSPLLKRNQRCAILADGFYEWTKPEKAGGPKQRFLFTLGDQAAFAFAGLWTSWTDPQSGEVIPSCTLITCSPSADVSPIHARMPVILAGSDHVSAWLSTEFDSRDTGELLGPLPAGSLTVTPSDL